MKKYLIGIIGGIAVILLILGTMVKTKSASAISIIGGADGPTSIFLAGKINSGFESAALIIGIIMAVIAIILYRKHK